MGKVRGRPREIKGKEEEKGMEVYKKGKEKKGKTKGEE